VHFIELLKSVEFTPLLIRSNSFVAQVRHRGQVDRDIRPTMSLGTQARGTGGAALRWHRPGLGRKRHHPFDPCAVCTGVPSRCSASGGCGGHIDGITCTLVCQSDSRWSCA
jgi:hypothetical protein